jgi:hypothetical protein
VQFVVRFTYLHAYWENTNLIGVIFKRHFVEQNERFLTYLSGIAKNLGFCFERRSVGIRPELANRLRRRRAQIRAQSHQVRAAVEPGNNFLPSFSSSVSRDFLSQNLFFSNSRHFGVRSESGFSGHGNRDLNLVAVILLSDSEKYASYVWGLHNV